MSGAVLVAGCCCGADADDLGNPRGRATWRRTVELVGGPEGVPITFTGWACSASYTAYFNFGDYLGSLSGTEYAIHGVQEWTVEFHCPAPYVSNSAGALHIGGVHVADVPCERWVYPMKVDGDIDYRITTPAEEWVPDGGWTLPCSSGVATGYVRRHQTGPDAVDVTENTHDIYTIYWIPTVTAEITALTVFFLSGGPWSMELSGGTLTLTRTATGTAYTFSGTLGAVRTAINATAGGTLISASFGSPITFAGTTTVTLADCNAIAAFTPGSSATIRMLAVGQKLQPAGNVRIQLWPTGAPGGSYLEGSTGIGCVPPSGMDGIHHGYFDAVGYPNTAAGALAWLRTWYYPKFTSEPPTMEGVNSGFGSFWSPLRGASSYTDSYGYFATIGEDVPEFPYWKGTTVECQPATNPWAGICNDAQWLMDFFHNVCGEGTCGTPLVPCTPFPMCPQQVSTYGSVTYGDFTYTGTAELTGNMRLLL